MQDTLSKIIYNEHVKGLYWHMGLMTGWKDYIPGQFVMIEIPGGQTFLRRPFSIARLEKGVVEFCYKIVGKGTDALSKVNVGSKIYVLGPIGNGFKIRGSVLGVCGSSSEDKPLSPKPNPLNPNPETLLVAGGYGIAPLLGLAEKLVVSRPPAGRAGQSSAVSLFYGTKGAGDLLYINEFEELGVELHISTEDGSFGEKGLVTDELKSFLLTTNDQRPTTIYACGPMEMLKKTAAISAKKNIDCQLSLESYMACGIGVCAGCVVKDARGEYVRVCKEGPVFKANDVSLRGAVGDEAISINQISN